MLLDELEENTTLTTATEQTSGEDSTPQSRLFAAVQQGDLEQVKALLPYESASSSSSAAAGGAVDASAAAPLSVNVVSSDRAGFTPLLAACRYRQADIARYLLSHPSLDVNARSSFGNSAFLYAAAKGMRETLPLLLEAGADFFATNENKDTCIMLACMGGEEETVEFLLEAFHNIQQAKAARSGAAAASTASSSPRRWVTLRNDDGLTALMCAAMSGSIPITQRILQEAREELGIHLPASQLGPEGQPDILRDFFPSIWEGVLGSADFDSAHSSYVDPSPPAFLQYINAQNMMGDTALHIAAESQNLDLFLMLLRNAGADPMMPNRRGEMPVKLFKEKGETQENKEKDKATVEEVVEKEEEAAEEQKPDFDASSKDTPTVLSLLKNALSEMLRFQGEQRKAYRASQAQRSDKLFSELMEEEEELQAQQAAGKKKKKNKQAKKEENNKGKKAKKKGSAATTVAVPAVTNESATKQEDHAEAATPSTEAPAAISDSPSSSTPSSSTSSPSSSPALAPASSASPLSASATSLSASAPPFIPLAELAALDAAAGWEVVTSSKQAKHASKPTAATASVTKPATSKPSKSHKPNKKKQAETNKQTTADASLASPPAHSPPPPTFTSQKKKKPITSPSHKNKSSAYHAKLQHARKEQQHAALAAAAPSTSPLSVVSSPPLLPTTSPILAPIGPSTSSSSSTSSALPLPSSSFFAAFHTGPPPPKPTRAWRPITALQRKAGAPFAETSVTRGEGEAAFNQAAAAAAFAAPTASSSPAPSDSLSPLLSLFSSLHPHIDSTDLQLSHFLGADWSHLSLSQLSVLDEVYSNLGRQIRERQFAIFLAQQQDVMSELVRTKSELHTLRREVENHRQQQQQQEQQQQQQQQTEH